MIEVSISRNQDRVQKVIVSGHANSNEYGKDLVCAGVSTIVTGIINSLAVNNIDNFTYIVKEGFTSIEVINSNNEIQVILKTMIIQLKTIWETNKKFIKITDGGV